MVFYYNFSLIRNLKTNNNYHITKNTKCYMNKLKFQLIALNRWLNVIIISNTFFISYILKAKRFFVFIYIGMNVSQENKNLFKFRYF